LCNTGTVWRTNSQNCVDSVLDVQWDRNHESCYTLDEKDESIFACSRSIVWSLYDYSNRDSHYESGGALVAKCSDVTEEEDMSSRYSSVCIQSDSKMNETMAVFDTLSKNNEPIYYWDYYYLYLSDNDTWVLQENTINEDDEDNILAVCEQRYLLNCTQNQWLINGIIVDRIKVSEGGCGSVEWEENDTNEVPAWWILPVIMICCIFAIVVAVVMLCFVICTRSAKQSQEDSRDDVVDIYVLSDEEK